jgi:invasion protein IalB
MTYRTLSARARTASKTFAALTASVAFAALAVSHSAAQQAPAPAPAPAAKPRPAPPARPAAQPAPQQAPAPQQQAAPQQAAPPQQGQGEQPQLIFSPWVKLCNKDPDPKAKRVCVTVKDGRVEALLFVSVAIIEVDGEARKLLRISLPYGVALQQGTRLLLDQNAVATGPFVTCLPPVVPPGGCIADYEANADLVGKMKKAQNLTIQALHMNGQWMYPALDLKDFAKAYDGPPTDPKVWEEQQKKLQEELQKRAEDARKRLENQQPAPQAGSPPPAR